MSRFDNDSASGRSTADLGQRLASLSPDRIKALVNKLGHGAGPAAAARPRMTRRPGERYPLSSAQERMWFLCQLAADPSVFNNPGVLRARIATPFEQDLLEQSLNVTARRHEILRTTFHIEDGRPVQVVHDEMPLTVGWDDLRGLPPDRQAREVLQLAYAEGRQPFDLATGPLIAMRVLRLSDTEYLLLVTSHHIVSDGWSNALFSKEVSATYHALVQGRPMLPAPELQYLDYVAWEQEWMQSDRCREQLAWWKAQLTPEVPPLPLPADRPRPPVASRAGGMETVVVPPALAAGLRRFAQEERVSLFQALMAGLMALLHRYTGQETITVGTSTANRNRREFQPVMGLFINTVVIRAAVDGDRPFRQFLHDVHAVCQDALRHQELPFEKLIGELNPPRALNVHPVFQVMFVHQNVPAQYEVPGMDLELVKVDYGTARFDLNLWAEETNDDLRLTLQYSRDLFDAGTVQRMLQHYQALLQSVLAAPDCPVSRLVYFHPEPAWIGESEDEGASAVAREDAEARGDALREAGSISRRFEAVAAQHPDAPAAEGPHETLTYRALNAAANQLARHLLSGAIAGNVGRDVPVGLLVSRSPRSLVGVMGIMKAGSAFLPLDPMQPPARLAALLQDAGARVLVTERHFSPIVEAIVEAIADTGAGHDLRVVSLDDDGAAIAAEGGDNLETAPDAEALAYVIYTSGTSGMPKGVAVEHRQLASYCDAVWRVMKLSAGHRCATVSSLAADLGHTMIFPPLLHGACVIVVPEDMVTDAVALSDYLATRPIDGLKIVPSHLRALMTSHRAAQILPRRLLMLGGETSSPDLIAKIREAAPRCRVVNHYGPTETTVGVLTWELPTTIEPDGAGMPLGVPLAGSRVYVLDAHQQPVPPGVPGEIYIGGANVARGYLGRPDLTRERFVPSPFVAGDRLYRTGDLAKRRADGAIVFLGRIDRQVKVRGFRVELREIEQVLSAHPAIEQAAVLPPRADDLRQPLVAWIQRTPGTPLDAEAVTQYLRGRVASYMIPGAIGILDALPLTPNGKIDYQTLASYDAEEDRRDPEGSDTATASTPGTARVLRRGPASAGAALQPRDPIELELTHVWQEVIGVERIGIGDNFFDLGGHSLLAAQLMARIHNRFGTHLPLATVFEHGTIRQMAEIIRTKAPMAAATPLVQIQPGRTGEPGESPVPLVFVHPAGGQVLCYMPLAQSLGGDIPVFGLQAVPRGDGSHEPVSISEMARAYLDALPPIARDRTPLLGGWSMGALVAFEMATLYARAHNRFPIVAILDQPAPQAASEVLSAEGAGTLRRASQPLSPEVPGERGPGGEGFDQHSDDVARLATFAGKASELVGHDLGLTEAALAGQSPDAQAALFLDRFVAHGLAPEGTTVAQFRGFLALMLRHNRITADYRPAVYPGKVVVFRAEHARGLEGAPGAGALGQARDRASDLGWQRYAAQPVEVIAVPGTHVSMMRAPHVRVLAERFAPCITAADIPPDATARPSQTGVHTPDVPALMDVSAVRTS